MAKTSFFFPLIVCFALLPASLGSSSRSRHQEDHCSFRNLNSQRPASRIESQAGFTEIWDENEKELDCVGVAPVRHTIRPRGLLLPSYSNSPRLVYVLEGEGINGVVIPGCPETFQSFLRSQTERSRRLGREESERRLGDEHQSVTNIRQGDVIALPAGFTTWTYNTADRPLILVTIRDISSNTNQLDRSQRTFLLAGNKPHERDSKNRDRQTESSTNIFNGFDTRILSEAFGVDEETARKLQEPEHHRGFIVEVDNLQTAMPRRRESRSSDNDDSNGIEDGLCNMRLHQNIDSPGSADLYSQQGGHLTTLNAAKLPILDYIRLGAERGRLRRNAMLAPHWNVNSHSVVYAIRGRAQMQIVDDSGRSVLDDTINEGEIVVVPQNYVVVKQAVDNDFEWVSFKTSNYPMTSQLAGRTSVLRGLPEDVLTNSYQISREEARKLKYGREEELFVLQNTRA